MPSASKFKRHILLLLLLYIYYDDGNLSSIIGLNTLFKPSTTGNNYIAFPYKNVNFLASYKDVFDISTLQLLLSDNGQVGHYAKIHFNKDLPYDLRMDIYNTMYVYETEP